MNATADRSHTDSLDSLDSLDAAPPALLDNVLHAVGLADEYAPWPSPVGDVFVAWNARGISCLSLAGPDPTEFESYFRTRVRRRLRVGDGPPSRVRAALDRRLSGKSGRTFADLRIVTPFERDVLECTARIPAGEARPYGWVAREIGRPGAVRAVGTALKHNPVPLLIPCHRVVRSDGRIGEYALGGPGNKRLLLTLEGVPVDDLEPVKGFVGSDTTHIFCLPWCRYDRKVSEVHRVSFRNQAEAEAAGYRACKHCRPVA
ncbi:MAG: methylated-DNA-[protein]-cysteine S-methyltransferase [Acidimicrobiaceae bacterium]|jgi:O-6-methylguanine DNA methyltransferase|nr:methylated-DNA-[protein]-cysteine S-methyltransferase [Acidimicrobiaceae bacterium]